MIFKQIDEILTGTKSQTRRVKKESEWLVGHDDLLDHYRVLQNTPGKQVAHTKWREHGEYAIVPKRGASGLYYKHTSAGLSVWDEASLPKVNRPRNIKPLLMADGWQLGRIRLLSIRCERLQEITEADARAEGVESVEAYQALWESINGKSKVYRWDANPHVWVLTFELVTL